MRTVGSSWSSRLRKVVQEAREVDPMHLAVQLLRKHNDSRFSGLGASFYVWKY
jgi:hypothetical protein